MIILEDALRGVERPQRRAIKEDGDHRRDPIDPSRTKAKGFQNSQEEGPTETLIGFRKIQFYQHTFHFHMFEGVDNFLSGNDSITNLDSLNETRFIRDYHIRKKWFKSLNHRNRDNIINEITYSNSSEALGVLRIRRFRNEGNKR